jgi:hypothetical protein
MDEVPINTARRLSRRAERHRCLQCGRKIRTEKHHVAGRNQDREFTVPLCQACHAQATEMLRRAGVDMATSVFLSMLAEALWRWAESLSV